MLVRGSEDFGEILLTLHMLDNQPVEAWNALFSQIRIQLDRMNTRLISGRTARLQLWISTMSETAIEAINKYGKPYGLTYNKQQIVHDLTEKDRDEISQEIEETIQKNSEDPETIEEDTDLVESLIVEEPYKCDYCDRTFTTKRGLTMHSKTHENTVE